MIGPIGGSLNVTDSDDDLGGAAWIYAFTDDDGNGTVAIGPVTGDVKVSATGTDGYAEIYGDQSVTFNSGPDSPAIGGSLIVHAAGSGDDTFSQAYLDPYGNLTIGGIGDNLALSASDYGVASLDSGEGGIETGNIGGSLSVTADNFGSAELSSGDNLTIGTIGGNFAVSATDGGASSIFAGNDLTIGNIGGSFAISADDSNDASVEADGGATIGAIAESFSISTNARLEADDGNLSLASIGGDFDNAGSIEVNFGTFSIDGPIGGTFVNAATGDIDVAQLDLPATIDQTFDNQGTVTIGLYGGGTSTIGVALDNSGAIYVHDATLDLDAAVDNTGGALWAEIGATIDVAAPITGGTVVIEGGTADLERILKRERRFRRQSLSAVAGLPVQQFQPSSRRLLVHSRRHQR